MIRPEFWTDGVLSECSLSARLLFIGTWTYADDNGNLDLCAKQIKMQIFPGDDVCIEPWINELIKHELLIPYEVDGKKYLNIKNFLRHQIINRPTPSGRPPYQESCRLTEYSLSTHPEVNRSKRSKRSKSQKLPDEYAETFQAFWRHYPRRIGKQVAYESFLRVVKDYPPEDVTAAAIEYARQCHTERKEEKFMLHPSTFLNKDRWKDYCFEEVKT